MKKSVIGIGVAAGAVACLLLLSGYLLYRESGFDRSWNGPKESPIEQPRVDRQDVKLDTSERRGAAATERYKYARGSADFNPLDLAIEAQSNPAAATDLAYYSAFCNRIVRLAAEGRKPDDRLKHPAWAGLAARCDPQMHSELLASLATAAKPQSDEWQALEQAMELPPTTLENFEARDRIASAILENSQDPELIAGAALVYFDRERLLVWAGSDIPQSFALGEVGNLSGFTTDLALTIACRVGRDCSPFALGTVWECVGMGSCRPGTSLEQIIKLRRSPQEMALLDEFARRVLQRRSRGG